MPRFEQFLPTSERSSKDVTREMLFLAEQAGETGITTLPSDTWALHYGVDAAKRADVLQQLLEGKVAPETVAESITPKAILYDAGDISKKGVEQVGARIREISSYIKYFDYKRFAHFVRSMQGKNIPLSEIDEVYRGLVQARVQKKLHEAYGATGQKQITRALQDEVSRGLQFPSGSRLEKVLRVAKAGWASDDLGAVPMSQKDQLITSLNGEERKIFEKIEKPYREFVQSGSEEGYHQLVEVVRENFKDLPHREGPSEEMQRLEDSLDQFKDQVGPPGSQKDPAIPPDDEDEYHTPDKFPETAKEKGEQSPIFEIKPTLAGYYVSGRKSYFDVDTKTWSKKKQLTPYNEALPGKDRTKISGRLDRGLKSLPIPVGYKLDASSFKYDAGTLQVFRDQNGCFYVQSNEFCNFSVDFLKAQDESGGPIAEDLQSLYRGVLSPKTEKMFSRLVGSSVQKAEQIRQYIFANHFYPGGGGLESAQALQQKLRSQSTGDNYLQNLDTSEYLECYSANTKFIALARKAGIPARLVVGHHVQGSKDGKSAINATTGHAWSEIWDGSAWRRFDATPKPKPEDKKDDQKREPGDSGQSGQAQDGGIESPQEQQEGQQSQGGQESQGQGQKSSSDPSSELGEASSQQTEQAQEAMQEAKKQLKQAQQQKDQLEKQAQEVKTFEDLKDLKEKIEQSEMFDDWKEQLEDKADAIEKQMKDALQDDLEKMTDDGFMDEKRRDELAEKLDKESLEELDKIQKQIQRESRLFEEFDNIREEVTPLVDEWFRYFVERLPKTEEVSADEDSLTRQGSFDRRSVMKPRNLLFGTVKNPRQIKPSVHPRFMAKIVVDVSRSMDEQGGQKMRDARKLAIFYSELFNKVSEEFGYIRYSMDAFSDGIIEIKQFDQEYDAARRYDYADGDRSTVKVRIMNKLKTVSGTNMAPAVEKAAADLNKETEKFPDYASAMYFVGDGGDNFGNGPRIREFLELTDSAKGFGEHMYSAVFLGDEAQRRVLADIFGDEHTSVASDFDSLVRQSMEKFEDDLEAYLQSKGAIQ